MRLPVFLCASRAMMSGCSQPEATRSTTLSSPCRFCSAHGMHDKFVPVEEDQRMAEVWHPSHHTPQIPPAHPRGLRSVLQPQGHQTLD